MALAINIADGHGLSNEGVISSLEEEQGKVVFAVHFAVKNQLYITKLTRWSASVLKVGVPCAL